ncbi:MAG TPA: biotin--[acetyl-CoA-carboxylase] ligase [Acidimicrobiales bacterium]|nr:biotin--[acetyl-CoA-carboxylase] ligase [Acidimicrobiales bacterium]
MAALSFQTMPASGEPGRFADVRRREQTDSTNADLLSLAAAGAPEGVVVVTDFQRSGRGRRGRTWMAPPGSALLASVLFRPALAPGAAHLVTMAAALAAADACGDVAGVQPGLKWPNDLVVERAGMTAKLAGLLAESMVEGDRLEAVVVGMGCNLRAAPAGAVHLEDLAGRPVDRDELLAAWLVHLDERYPTPSEAGALLDDYRRRCTTLSRTVRVELEGAIFEGRAVDVTEDGHLLVNTVGGTRDVAAGDVVHLRPAEATGPGRSPPDR